MRHNWRRRVAVLGLVSTIFLSGTQAKAFNLLDGWFTPTGYVEVWPTSYSVPVGYLSPTSYILPTSYAAFAPTEYITTAYLAPTAYVATSYVPTVWASPTSYVATAYSSPVVSTSSMPSASIYPTVYESPISYAPTYYLAPTMMASSSPCGETSPVSRSYPAATPSVPTQPAPKKVESEAPSVSSKVVDPPPTPPRAENRSSIPTPDTTVAEPKDNIPVPVTQTPPAAPTVPRDKEIIDLPGDNTAKPGDAAKPAAAGTEPTKKADPAAAGGTGAPASGSNPIPPTAPAGTDGDSAAPTRITPPSDGQIQRTSQKPVLPTKKPYLRTTAKGDLNLLEGLVKSVLTGLPESGVEVMIASKSGALPGRAARSDGSGRYAVRLPDGDWTVRVLARNGESYPVSSLSVKDGQIIDDQNRDIPTLNITR